jgi:hypothetical protein
MNPLIKITQRPNVEYTKGKMRSFNHSMKQYSTSKIFDHQFGTLKSQASINNSEVSKTLTT